MQLLFYLHVVYVATAFDTAKDYRIEAVMIVDYISYARCNGPGEKYE